MIAASIMLFYLVDNLWLESYLLQAYAMLTIYHYQKQNIGVYSLLAPAIGGVIVASNKRMMNFSCLLPVCPLELIVLLV
jgi:hypothetical protein